MNTFEKGMTQLLISHMSELFFCESKLVGALDKMSRAASDERLRKLFTAHREETIGHIQRLEEAFAQIGERPRAFPCRGMEGLLDDGVWLMQTMKGTLTLDHALIGAAQKVEMLEIASYRSLVRLARQLGQDKLAQLFEGILDEEHAADLELSALAKEISTPSLVTQAHG